LGIMEIKIFEANNHKIAEIKSAEIVISDTQGALDLMADAGYYEARRIIISETNLKPEFFDLHYKSFHNTG